ncbi:amino acid adenylation domain-containing protein [Actinomadura soli]|uniref:Amino acid adenylation domain-containing protein n=1 Tax=Actinomadura soli TaxID=2508997 RepID=A0A5C4JIG8_9ACTN|nr:non-ribosomal peptide synthetase [Actinomadura soli]TMR06543.1 amino acid adenylation domain-containing protein [Actinomadura soli]
MLLDGKTASIIGQIQRQVLSSPTSIAVSDDTESVSYRELWRRTETVTRLLRATGSRPGRPVGLCMSPTVDRVASMLGTMGSGSPYVPIDPNFPDSRIRAIIDSAAVERVVVDERTAKRFAAMPYELLEFSAASSGSSPGPVDRGVVEPGGSDLAYIIHTSGSTGEPKGVAVEHGSVNHLFHALDGVIPQLPDRSAQCWLAAANVCFDMSIVDLFWPLTRGVPLVVADVGALAGRSYQSAEFLTGVLASGRVTHFQSTPSLVQLMLQDPVLAASIHQLHVLIMGGEIVQPELVAQLRPVPHIFNGYGPTETTVYTTLHECSDGDTEHVPIGRALGGVDLRVVDESGRDCPPGVLGELLIGGPGLARGYINDEDLTARKFPVLGDRESRRRWYRTGDVVSIDEAGTVRYQGRVDGQVKVRGFRVELGEIEAAIRAVPGIEEAAVFPVRDPSARVTGLTAVVKSASAAVSEAGVIAEISKVLPPYAVPNTVKVLPELPIGVTGKLDRKTLEHQLAAMAPAARLKKADEDPAGRPAGSYERIVAETWSSVLGEAIDTDGNFFDLGGNSILLGSVHTRLRGRFPEANLQMVEMYRYPTIATLAARLRTGPPTAHGAPARPQPPVGGSVQPDRRRRVPPNTADRRRLARRADNRGNATEGRDSA